ncbi:serine hydrolase [Brevibacillus fulvus]|uniref:Beta-lactamase class A n=1 Tax=Brevibacillus fulvus TaxID=1125967 RepID=A0A938Y111_9BACL|nr:serine hydrolase [Brevibacillus fulvus]MBM7590046.1 beta-lactamase class A [Brevibacillus fulvus]
MQTLVNEVIELTSQAGGTWGIVLENADTGCRWGTNEQLPFIAESVMKLPIMVAVYALAEQGRLALDEQLAIRREDRVGGSGVLQHLSAGLALPVRDLLTLMIIQSDNTATNLLIERIGPTAIQETMKQLGMTRSRFYRKMMIYPQDVPQVNLLTASDVAGLLSRLANRTILAEKSCTEMVELLKKQQVCNGLPSLLPQDEDWQLAHKSGWDTGRMHEAGILYVRGRTIIISVFSEGVEHPQALNTLGRIGAAVYRWAKHIANKQNGKDDGN